MQHDTPHMVVVIGDAQDDAVNELQ